MNSNKRREIIKIFYRILEIPYVLKGINIDVVSPNANEILEEYIEKGEYKAALDVLHKLENSTPGDSVIKMRLQRLQGQFDEALQIGYLIIEEDVDDYILAEAYLEISYSLWYMGKNVDAKSYINKAELSITELDLSSKFEKNSVLRLRGLFFHIKYLIFYSWSDPTATLDYLFKSMEIRIELGDRRNLALGFNNVGVSYWYGNQLDNACEYFEKSLEINLEIGNDINAALTLENLVEISVLRKDIPAGEEYNKLLKELSEKEINRDNKFISLYSGYATAYILSNSSSLKDKLLAEEHFEKLIIQSKGLHPQFYTNSIFNLCEIHLFELKVLNNEKMFNKIYSLINILIDFASSENIKPILFQAKLLEAKLLLIQNNVKKAKEILMEINDKAQKIGDMRFGNLISIELDKLLDLEIVLSSMDKDSTIRDKLHYINLEEILHKFASRNYSEYQEVNETPVALLILNEDGTEIYSKIFDGSQVINEQLIASFLSAINIFANEAFGIAEGYIERIKHNQYIITMKKKENVVFCYIYKGASNLAVKRINNLIVESTNLISILNNNLGFVMITSGQIKDFDDIVDKIFVEVS